MSLRSVSATQGRVLVLAQDPVVIATARDAARRMKLSTAVLESGRQALALLTAPGRAQHRVICDPGAAQGACWPDLMAAAAEQGEPSLLVVSDAPIGSLPRGMRTVPTDSAALAAALEGDAAGGREFEIEAAALRSGLGRGEITVAYQPMVRVADRQPVMVEALARWAPSYPPIAPDHFLPLAARAGLMRELSMAVAAATVREIGPLRQRLRIGVTLNLPLDLLRQPDLPMWLRRIAGYSALGPERLSIELTEHHEVHDRIALERVLRRLRHAGHGVFLDDILMDDPRENLFGLDFQGLKLDRSFITALPTSGRARQALKRMVKAADARGQVLVAEGVSHPSQMRMLAEFGVHWAQGFLISRPLPANALLAWSELWRAGRPL